MSALSAVVAVNTFREAIRDRVLYNLVFFTLLIMAAAIFLGEMSLGIERILIINLGLATISIVGLIMAIFIGVALVSKEIDKRTLYSVLSKPVQRWEFLAGKFGGLILTLFVNTILMAVGLAAALFYVRHSFTRTDVSIVAAIYFILLELGIVTALSLFFSTFTTPMLSTVFTLSIFIAGTFAPDLRDLGRSAENPFLGFLLRSAYYLLPNFHNFNAIALAAHSERVPGILVLQNTIYAGIYCAILLFAASAIFSTRDLK